jgi:hypothetical protein
VSREIAIGAECSPKTAIGDNSPAVAISLPAQAKALIATVRVAQSRALFDFAPHDAEGMRIRSILAGVLSAISTYLASGETPILAGQRNQDDRKSEIELIVGE